MPGAKVSLQLLSPQAFSIQNGEQLSRIMRSFDEKMINTRLECAGHAVVLPIAHL
jgi:hypothetical protein